MPAEVPDWNEVYKDPTLPLMVDIGCGMPLNFVISFCLSKIVLIKVISPRFRELHPTSIAVL